MSPWLIVVIVLVDRRPLGGVLSTTASCCDRPRNRPQEAWSEIDVELREGDVTT